MRRLRTATELMQSRGSINVGEIVEVRGYSIAGDGGAASWVFNGVVGETPSQTPAQLGHAYLTDASGNRWELIYGKTILLEKLGGAEALQSALNTKVPKVTWISDKLYLDPVRYTIFTGQHLAGPGIEKSTLFVHADFSTTDAQFENEHPNSPTDGVRYDKDIVFSGFTIDASARKYAAWLSDSSGAPITDPEFDYSPSGIIGMGGDIFDVVAADRRNPDYADIGWVIKMLKVERPIIRDIRITGHESLAIVDEGCLSMRIRNCHFDNQGKVDNISSAVWAQSHGNVGGGDPWYQDSEDHVTEYCTFDCKRSAITLNPTKGGAFRFNTVYKSGESAVFSGLQATNSGGSIHIHDNKFGPTILTDIVADHIENNGNGDYHVYNNFMEDADGASFNIFGSKNCTVHGNTIKSPWRLTVPNYPYGPFSERYAFDVGRPPIAGTPVSPGGYIIAGTLLGIGANVNVIHNNVFIDENPSSNAVGILELTKSGGNNLSKNISIHSNDMNLITDPVPLLYQPVADVMDLEMSLEAYDNVGIESGEAVIYSKQLAISETGPIEVDIGFRPRRLKIYAALNAGGSKQGSIAEVNYSKAGYTSTCETFAEWVIVFDNQAFRIVDAAGAIVARGDFVRFTETGFYYNPIVVNAITNLRIVCYP